MKHSTVGFIASGRPVVIRRRILVNKLSYTSIQRNEGNHFNKQTGEFTAPVDGPYIASLTIEPTVDVDVKVWIKHRSEHSQLDLGYVETNDNIKIASSAFVVWMKAGDCIMQLSHRDFNCRHFSCFLLGI